MFLNMQGGKTKAHRYLQFVQALAALADNAKHNQTGRVDEHGALRHRLPELCGVGALALLFFAHFHVLGQPVPEFSPDFNEPDCGQYGVRAWYKYHVFWPTRKSPTSCLTYESECDEIKSSQTQPLALCRPP